MFIISGFVLLVILYALSAFWSGSETALTSLSKYRVRKIIAQKKSISGPMTQWLKAPYYYLTTILIGNTITNLFLSFFATILLMHVFAPVKFLSENPIGKEFLEFLIWIAVTFTLLIFSDVTPKVFSRQHSEKVTVLSLPILAKVTDLSKPIVWVVVKLLKIIFPKSDLVFVSKLAPLGLDEINGLISESNTAGALGKDTGMMIERVLKLKSISVKKIMTSIDKIESVDFDQNQESFLDLVVETGRSRVPVYRSKNENIEGFVHTKDLLWAWKQKKGTFSADLIRPAYFVNEDKSSYELLKEFQTGKTHIAFVKDTLGNLTGLITLEDILEEIIGEILDEYDAKSTEGMK